MFARVVEQVVRVQDQQDLPNGVGVLVVPLDVWADSVYEAYVRQPQALYFDGRVYGKSCFDSDRNIAIYRTDISLAAVELVTV